jgi:hypothetical protein
MNNLAKVENHEELRKDMKSGALLLTDRTVADEYISKKTMLKSVYDVNTEINILKDKISKIDKVENDLEEIKALLRGLVK